RHTLRHTAITHLVQAGVDLPTVQRVSGHKSFAMVFRYSHQNQQHVQEALIKLDSRIVVDLSMQSMDALKHDDYTEITHGEKDCASEDAQVLDRVGRQCRDRTCDQRIKSPQYTGPMNSIDVLETTSIQCSRAKWGQADARHHPMRYDEF